MSTDGRMRLNELPEVTSFSLCSQSSSISIKKSSDIFSTTADSAHNSKSSTDQKRERFASRRPRSLKDIFFRSKNPDKNSSIEKGTSDTKSKFSNIVSKHILPFKFVRNLRTELTKPERPDTASCPNLAKRNSVETLSEKPEETVVAPFTNTPDQESPEEAKISPFPASQSFPKSDYDKPLYKSFQDRNPLRVQHLAIPKQNSDSSTNKGNFPVADIFTTSFTHSTSPKINHSLSKLQCKSAQELPKSPIVAIKQRLIRSYSDTPPRLSIKSQGSTASLKIPTCLQSRMYRDDCVSQILDYLFIGSIEVPYNEPKLCRLKIDSLVDISNLSSAQVPSSKKLHCPCLCGHDSRHFRSRLIIRVEDDDKEDIEQYFSEINKFIDGARKCGKNVLIFSYHGNSRAPAAAIQYLMSHEGFLLRQAYNLVKNQRPSVDINQRFQNSLEALERRLFPEAKPSLPFSNDYLNIADPQAIKCAWVDCSDM
ncbi:uncharacterized protein LOC133186444 [Saccostrea echinata]|uniref:uncharacterized protein LOC133186444 n=1 Tax=Saccostrea echinata TaxID=191078 RepID=UPI002A80F8E7|nr:uncharacterized protein LOC133186444 [Saccostrea echinata]